MSKKIQISAALLGVLVTTAIIAGTTYASPGDGFLGMGKGENTQCYEDNQPVREALDNNNYTEWLKAVGTDSKIAGIIDSSNFSRYVEAHTLMQEARVKTEEARAIFEELGVNIHSKGDRGQRSRVDNEAWQASRDAIDAKDYTAWLEALGENNKISEIINTEEKFLKLAEAHELMKNGDFDGAKEIRNELGLETGKGSMGINMGKKGRR